MVTKISTVQKLESSTSINNSSIDTSFSSKTTAKTCSFLRYRYGFFKTIHKISLEYQEYQLWFYWISRIRCGFKLDSRIAIEQKIVMNHCPTTCPYCGESPQSFTHWILHCKKFQDLVVLDSERDYDDNINYLLLNVLLG